MNTEEKIALACAAIGFGLLIVAHKVIAGSIGAKLAPVLQALGG